MELLRDCNIPENPSKRNFTWHGMPPWCSICAQSEILKKKHVFEAWWVKVVGLSSCFSSFNLVPVSSSLSTQRHHWARLHASKNLITIHLFNYWQDGVPVTLIIYKKWKDGCNRFNKMLISYLTLFSKPLVLSCWTRWRLRPYLELS